MPGDLKERFNVNIYGVARSYAQWSAANTTTYITGANVNIPMRPGPSTYRISLVGTKTGANAAMKVGIRIGATALITITADDTTAVDWHAEFIIAIVDPHTQKASGFVLTDTADPATDYAAGTIDLTPGVTMTPFIVSQHASDTVTCEICTVEYGEQ